MIALGAIVMNGWRQTWQQRVSVSWHKMIVCLYICVVLCQPRGQTKLKLLV